MRHMKFYFVLVITLLLFTSCDQVNFKTSKRFIDGKVVSAATLNEGRQIYLEYCMACHGMNGEANGPAAKGSNPPPRNFTQGLYKFGLTQDGGLPTDQDFYRIIKHGLKGTGMLAWDMSPQQVDAVTQYIKTLAPQVWEKGDPSIVGKPVVLKADPFTIARTKSAIERGKEVYHFVGNCQTCHRAYLSPAEYKELGTKVTGSDPGTLDASAYELKQQESQFYLYDKKDQVAKYLPPDFTWHQVRSVSTVEEIAQRLCAGVNGSGMPAWCGVLSDDDLWAVSYYVYDLMQYRGNINERKKFEFSL